MDLFIIIKRCDMKFQGNFFLFLQLEEEVFPSKQLKKQKQRSDICIQKSAPDFVKNLFKFKNLCLGNRIKLNIGSFITQYNVTPKENNQLFKNSVLLGEAQLVLTQKIITNLRDNNFIDFNICLFKQDANIEAGRLLLQLKLKPSNFEQKIIEDNRKIENLYYNPNVQDEDAIKEKVASLQNKLLQAQLQLENVQKKQDFIKTESKSISVLTANLQKEKLELDEKINDMSKNIKKMQSVEELHIQIDLLIQSEHGQNLLKEKLALFLQKLEFERMLNNDLQEQYFQIQSRVKYKDSITQEIKDIKQALDQQKFHLNRYMDQKPQIITMQNTIRNQEQLIQNLTYIVKTNMKKLQNINCKELESKIREMSYEREMLREKYKQVMGNLDLYQNKLPLDFFSNLKDEPYLKEDPNILQEFKQKAEKLLELIQKLSMQLEESNAKKELLYKKIEYNQLNSPFLKQKFETLKWEYEMTQNKAEIIEKEMQIQVRGYAEEISELQATLSIINSQLNIQKNKNSFQNSFL